MWVLDHQQNIIGIKGVQWSHDATRASKDLQVCPQVEGVRRFPGLVGGRGGYKFEDVNTSNTDRTFVAGEDEMFQDIQGAFNFNIYLSHKRKHLWSKFVINNSLDGGYYELIVHDGDKGAAGTREICRIEMGQCVQFLFGYSPDLDEYGHWIIWAYDLPPRQDRRVCLGYRAGALEAGNIAVGAWAYSEGPYTNDKNVAYGYSAFSGGGNATVAVGAFSDADASGGGDGGVAIGYNAYAQENGCVSVGAFTDSQFGTYGSICLGYGAHAAFSGTVNWSLTDSTSALRMGGIIQLVRRTTDATVTDMYNNAAEPVTDYIFINRTNSVMYAQGYCCAYDVSGGYKVWRIDFLITTDGSSVHSVRSDNITVVYTSGVSWNLNTAYSSGKIKYQVTGAISTTVDWFAFLEYCQTYT